ncbi:hypothetical protein ACQ4XT_06405 [Halobacillus faecis]
MEVKSFLNGNKNYKVEISEKFTYKDKTSLEEYKKLFELMKDAGYVKAYSFSAITWYLPCPVTHKDILFNFDVGGFKSFSPSLKSYVLLRRKSGKRPFTIKSDLKRLKDVIISTNGLQDKEKIKEFFHNPTDLNECYRACYTLVNYLEFHPIHSIQKTVTEVFEGLKYPTYQSRELPPFEDVLIFDDCVDKYYSDYSLEDNMKFYPIYLWWTITNVIPMRVIEFLRIKANSIKIKDDGSYWITIPRFKLKSSSPEEIYWEQSILIDEKVYYMIKNYCSRLRDYNVKTDFMIPPLNQINKRFRTSYTVNDNVTNTTKFNNLIRFFYEEVIEGLYGEIGLSRVTAGDTRHFSIINLFLQGFNILSITRLAGHDEITSPSNYYNHAKHYSTSFVYKLAQRKLEGDISNQMSNGFVGMRAEKVWEAKANSSFDENWRRVEYGFCKDTHDFPSNCIEDCRLCGYYAFRPSVDKWKDGIKWLESYSKELEAQATSTLNLLATVSLETYEKLKGIEEVNEVESKSLSVQLFKNLDHKAIIDARLMEEDD